MTTYEKSRQTLLEKYISDRNKATCEAERKLIYIDHLLAEINLAKQHGKEFEIEHYKNDFFDVINTVLKETELKQKIANLEYENKKLMLQNKKLSVQDV